MKHKMKLQKKKHPLWHFYVCANCGEVVRFSKWETHQLMRDKRRFIDDFLPPCSPVVPEVKASREGSDGRR